MGKVYPEFKTNSNGVNSLIKYNILSEEEMRDIGFTDYSKDTWFYERYVKFPKDKKYRNIEISFSVSIPKDGGDLRIDVLDEDFLQPYDYQRMLEGDNPPAVAFIVDNFVEEQMEYLQEKDVLSGHLKGEYI